MFIRERQLLTIVKSDIFSDLSTISGPILADSVKPFQVVLHIIAIMRGDGMMGLINYWVLFERCLILKVLPL